MSVDLDMVRARMQSVPDSTLRNIANSAFNLMMLDVPSMIHEIESLRSEVSRLNKELTEHRASLQAKQDFIMGEPRGVHKP